MLWKLYVTMYLTHVATCQNDFPDVGNSPLQLNSENHDTPGQQNYTHVYGEPEVTVLCEVFMICNNLEQNFPTASSLATHRSERGGRYSMVGDQVPRI
ncbi:hypothetical protein EDD15DRAFT_2247714 [Pisolithus albus]|nr:hypothetical protein EDD15DRAFT_2247714 [Pisolithus albus]